MAVKFVIKKFYRNGNSEYLQAKWNDKYLFTMDIYLAWPFDTYREAEEKIKSMEAPTIMDIYQIEKLFLN